MSSNPYKGLGGRLRQRRKEMGLTQSAVAERVGISLNSYQAIESGRSVPRRKTAESIATALEWENGDAQASEPFGEQDQMISAVENALRVYRRLGPELCEFILTAKDEDFVTLKRWMDAQVKSVREAEAESLKRDGEHRKKG